MEILELPQERATVVQPKTGFDFASLSNVLFESADMLEESRDSGDEEFKTAAIELAVRSLYTASAAIDRYVAAQQPAQPNPARLISGPWAKRAKQAE
jgi:hypothetical protein